MLLPSVSARREAFDEYCRERARELRASRVKKEKEDPKEEFENLLTTEVKSTRMNWTDFRRQWKKDRRFYGWGRDDREREKRFREFLGELGESTCSVIWRSAALELHSFREARTRPESGGGFFCTSERKRYCTRRRHLERGKSSPTIRPLFMTVFQVKKSISEDPRYDAVGSSSLREELFSTFLKAQANRTLSDQSEKQGTDISSTEPSDETQKRKDRKAQAVKEREEKIKAERERVQATIEKSRVGLNREEGEQQFRCAAATYSRLCESCAGAHQSITLRCRTLLTDAIREPQVLEAFLRGQQSDRSYFRHRGNHPWRSCRPILVFDIHPCPWATNAIYSKCTWVHCVRSTWTICMRSSVPTLL